MNTPTFMDNAAIGAVLAAILFNVLHGAVLAALEPRPVIAVEVTHV
jgi:hypothetical protein